MINILTNSDKKMKIEPFYLKRSTTTTRKWIGPRRKWLQFLLLVQFYKEGILCYSEQ